MEIVFTVRARLKRRSGSLFPGVEDCVPDGVGVGKVKIDNSKARPGPTENKFVDMRILENPKPPREKIGSGPLSLRSLLPMRNQRPLSQPQKP